VAETWERELGIDEAVALMRAQNEPAETVVRLVRGEIEGREDEDVPGAWHVERVDEQALADGRIWPQSRASQLVGLAVGSREGERTLDLCARRGKATMLAGEVVAVDVNEARARELEQVVRRLEPERAVVVVDGRALPPEHTVRPRARGRPVLRPRSS
jgi:16S rRNA C967 or C1407 C5-methylase (RsmB/RsmF family)